MIDYDHIPPRDARVRVSYPDGTRSSLGYTLARHGGYEPTYRVRLDSGVIAWYPKSWLIREDDPDRMPAVTR